MEVLWILVGFTVVAGPWVLAGIALSRANRARAEARRAGAAADAAMLAVRALQVSPVQPAATPAPQSEPAPIPLDTVPIRPPPLPPPLPVEVRAPAPGAAALEEKIALVWFTRAGALAILLGAAYFLKYAIDNEILGPWGRIAAASLGGAAALAGGEALRARTRAVWIHALQGSGIALLFLAGFGSHVLYRLVPVGVAFAAVTLIALLGGALAVRHRAELLLGVALAGGLLAPVLLSTGEDRPLALFGYLLLLCGAALLVSVRLGFRAVPWLAFAGATVLGGAWYERFFDVRPPPAPPSASLPLDEQVGSYFPLAHRLVPLGAALAFSLSWLAAHARLRRSAPRAWSDAWLAAALLFAHAAPFAVVFDRPLLAGSALALAGVLSARLLARSGRQRWLLGAQLAALALFVIGIALRPSGPSGPWLAAIALLAAAYLAIVAHAWLVRGDPPAAEITAVAALAGLAFAGLTFWLTSPDDRLLRAALVGAAGAAELCLGAGLVRRDRAHASAVLGAALALLAVAAAFLFTGATVTVIWAAMACVAAVLAARARDVRWLSGALALFAAALARIATVDARAPAMAQLDFLRTAGAEGRPAPLFLANPRALALAATALALVVAARAVRRAHERWTIVGAVLVTAGAGLAVALAVTEAQDLVLALPPPPPVGDRAAFADYRLAVSSARAAQWGTLSATASLVLAACAALLVAGGFVLRSALHRWLGLALFGVVLGKLLLADVWRLSRLEQVAVFLSVGALLLSAAFLYARFGPRLAAALRDEPPRRGGAGALLVLLCAGLAAPAHADALEAAPFRIERELSGVAAPGLHAFEADAELFQSSRAPPGSLADVRIEGPGGAEVPVVVRVAGGGPAERTVDGTVVDPVVLPGGAVRALVDLGASPPRHGELRLELAGDEFLREVRLEVSEDGRRFGVLAEGERVWSVAGVTGAAGARSTVVRHAPSEARFVRVTLLPGAGEPPRITGARAALGAKPEVPLRLLPLSAAATSRSPDGAETLLDLDLGAPGLPVELVELTAGTPAFERRVRVLASDDGAHWSAAGGGVVWRALPKARGGAAEGLRLAVATGGRRWIRLAIQDGSSAPLEITALRAGWRRREVVFSAAAAGPHLLLVGAEVPAPAYDLARLLARSEGAPAAAARLGPSRPNPRHRLPVPSVPFSERHRTALAAGLAGLLAVLGLWAIRLLRKESPRAPGEP